MLILPFAVALLLLAAALLAASETSLFALVRMERARESLAGAVRSAVDRLMERPLESLVVIIGLNEAANIFAECLATAFLLFVLGPRGAWVAVPTMLALVLLIGEITPKTFALGFPAGVAALTARPLARLTDLLHPVLRLFITPPPAPRPEPVSETEFKALLRVSERYGQIQPAERELIHKVFEFGGRRAAEVMTPREKIFSLDISTPSERLTAEVAGGHFSRIPVYRGDSGNIVGVLHAKDVVARRLEPTPPRLERLLRPAYFVPARKPVGELFEEMRRDRVQLALVVDEYGVLVGLVSLEDLLEELFGEIRDEFDVEMAELTRVGEGEWLVGGGVDLVRLRETVGAAHLPPPEAAERTLGRLVLRRLGRIPRPGDKFRLGDFEATVEKVRGASLELLRLKL